ncbi:amidohydrolase [Aliamphritea spongicola]|uniref:amidohydrolase n=1 Tax=Aliamphritea spongicola TaxID=707589 RepID=UPI00196A3C54|nr:amidohydrolase [Aliamphritea spongicola]MBN3562938.1 amidohydrolase [Aliamphritea spongicola]
MKKLSFVPLLFSALLCSPSAFATDAADTLVVNAIVYADQPAEAIAITDGKITFVGSNQQARALQGNQTDVLDMEGAMVLPGFIDNHNHVFEAASEAGGSCELSPDEDLNGQIPYLEACAEQAEPGQWLIGYGFSLEMILDGKANAQTPLSLLDEFFPDQPVILMEQTSHSMWVNSTALEQAGITASSPEPQGGRHLKDPDSGELNGILLDNAGDIVMELAWNNLNNVFQRSYNGLLDGLYIASEHGITTIGDGRMYWQRGWYEVWQAARKNGDLTARVSLRPWIYPEGEPAKQLAFLEQIQSRQPDSLLIVDQVKMYSDGILTNATAKIISPYRDSFVDDMPYGLNYIPPEDMKLWLSELNKIGYGAHIHAIGDGAVRESLNAIEAARRQGSDQDYSLTHVEMIQNSDIKRFKPLNVTADFQIASSVGNHDWAIPFIGRKRSHQLMQLRPIYDAGANLTLSSDWNVNDINPLAGISTSIQMGKRGMPDIYAAIDAYTIKPAISLGLDDITGSIEVGKSADLVVLSEDITQIAPAKVADTQILMTILQGEIVYEAED